MEWLTLEWLTYVLVKFIIKHVYLFNSTANPLICLCFWVFGMSLIESLITSLTQR
jgi:hypothetical protein